MAARPMILVPQSKFRLMEERISTVESVNTPDATASNASIQDGVGNTEKDCADIRSSGDAIIDSGDMVAKEDKQESRPVFQDMSTDGDTDTDDDDTTEELRSQNGGAAAGDENQISVRPIRSMSMYPV
jgi:hypothetical protein